MRRSRRMGKRLRPLGDSRLRRVGAWALLLGLAGDPAVASEYAFLPPEVRLAPPDFDAKNGPALRRALDATVPGVGWRNVSLRSLLEQVERGYGVCMLRDRRIDPTRRPEVAASNIPLRALLSDLASAADAELRFVGDAAYLGPPEAAAVVRTLAELRRQELVSAAGPAARRTALQRSDAVRWSDLTSSADVLHAVAARFGLTIENPEDLPHDLWPGGTLAGVSAAEGLTLVLIQFDLTFAWSNDLRSIRLVPLPSDRNAIVLTRALFSRDRPPGQAAVAWEAKVPGIEAAAQADRVVVTGTVEQFEALEAALATGGPGPRPREPKPPDISPLSRRRFTLTVARVPASAMMAKLEESGVVFEHDAAAFAAAGIDLDSPVTIDVRQATADEFLQALFDPLGVAFETRGVVVRLRPK